MNIKFVIKLTSVNDSKSRRRYLNSVKQQMMTKRGTFQRGRITTTQFTDRARKFATQEDAQAFIAEYAHKFHYSWSVIEVTA